MRRNTRPAFTLMQLLILIAFLAILIGLLFAAVERVRHAADQMSGINHLKQLGLAMHNHHDVYGQFPPGRDAKGFSAHAKFLPYLEQEAVYKGIDFNVEPTAAANAKARALRIKLFESPQDPHDQPVDKVGPVNYLCVAGSKAEVDRNDGAFPDRAIRFADITDGLSNTVVMVETLKGDGGKKAESVARQHVRLKKEDLKSLKEETGVKDFKDNTNVAGDRGASWIEGRFLYTYLNVNRLPNDEKPDVDCGGDGGLSGPRTLGKTFTLWGDGSVRPVSNKVTLETWKAMATRNGGEVINTDGL